MAEAKNTKQTEQAEPPAIQWPFQIRMGPEMHVYNGKRYGPGVASLHEADFQKVDPNTGESSFDLYKFNTTKNALIASVRRTHESNKKRLGQVARELGPNNASADNLKPPPIHESLPDTTNDPEDTGSPPVGEHWGEGREHDPNENLPDN